MTNEHIKNNSFLKEENAMLNYSIKIYSKNGTNLPEAGRSQPKNNVTGINVISTSCVGCVYSHNELDADTIRALEIFTNCVLVNVICFFGMVGNAINIAVLREHGFKETTNIILASLSMSDLMFCVIVPITKLRCLTQLLNDALSISVHTFATVYLFMPKYVCLASSCCYVSVIAVERFVAVFFPFHVSKIFTRSVMRLLVTSVPILTAGAMVPTFFALTYDWVYDPRFNLTVAVMRYTQFYMDYHTFIDPYTWVGLSNGFCATSIIVVTVCCLAIGFKLTRAAMKREKMTNRTPANEKVVKMLVTVCVVYIIAATPTVGMYSYYQPNFIFISPIYELVDNFGVLLSSVNASANFVVYVTMSDKFARTYRKLLTCSKKPKLKHHKTYTCNET